MKASGNEVSRSHQLLFGRAGVTYFVDTRKIAEVVYVLEKACRHYRKENDKAKHVYRLKKEEAAGAFLSLFCRRFFGFTSFTWTELAGCR